MRRKEPHDLGTAVRFGATSSTYEQTLFHNHDYGVPEHRMVAGLGVAGVMSHNLRRR